MNVFDTSPELSGQFKRDAKVFPLTNLQASAIVIHLYHPLRGLHKLGKGSVVITDSLSGMFNYYWNSNDTSMEGLWNVWAELRTANGPLSSTNVETLEVTNRVRGYTKHVRGRVKIV